MKYCEEHQYEYKTFDPYDSEIVDKIIDYDIILFDHHQADYRDVLFAKQLLFSLEQAGKIVFPNFRTGWHFDDKLGQTMIADQLDFFDTVYKRTKSIWQWIREVKQFDTRLLMNKRDPLPSVRFVWDLVSKKLFVRHR